MDTQENKLVHLGLILDGNRRWARAKGLPTLEGHRIGYDNLKEVAIHAFNSGIEFVSAFVFSTENWARTKEEVKYLMGFTLQVLTKDLVELNKKNIKIVWLGTTDKLSKRLISAIKNAEEKTRNNTKGTLCICFNYGGHQELVDAFKKIIKSKIPIEKVNIDTIAQSLYAPEVPMIDLLIRTSGETRVSGFMLWRMAYAELYFSNKYWRDFHNKDLDVALKDYYERERRFGK